jgi:hypothetical protein
MLLGEKLAGQTLLLLTNMAANSKCRKLAVRLSKYTGFNPLPNSYQTFLDQPVINNGICCIQTIAGSSVS